MVNVRRHETDAISVPFKLTQTPVIGFSGDLKYRLYRKKKIAIFSTTEHKISAQSLN